MPTKMCAKTRRLGSRPRTLQLAPSHADDGAGASAGGGRTIGSLCCCMSRYCVCPCIYIYIYISYIQNIYIIWNMYTYKERVRCGFG